MCEHCFNVIGGNSAYNFPQTFYQPILWRSILGDNEYSFCDVLYFRSFCCHNFLVLCDGCEVSLSCGMLMQSKTDGPIAVSDHTAV